jgi:hypothetical protein
MYRGTGDGRSNYATTYNNYVKYLGFFDLHRYILAGHVTFACTTKAHSTANEDT